MYRMSLPLFFVIGMSACLMATPGFGQPDEEGFVRLFDGESLDGWKVFGDPAGFKLENGVVRSMARRGGQVIYYDREQFGNFVLRVEWRVSPKGNCGVFLRTPQVNNPWETGYEVQIISDQPPADAAHCTGALYGYAGVDPRPDENPEKWRLYEITAEGPVITVKVDGQQVVRHDQSKDPKSRDKPLKGYIGLQDSHGPEGSWVEYRRVAIKKL